MTLGKVASMFIGAILLFGTATSITAEDKKAKEDRVSGNVVRMDSANKHLTVRPSGKTIERTVVLNDSTQITKGNKPGASASDLTEGTRVICLGKFNDKAQLEATRIDIRTPKM